MNQLTMIMKPVIHFEIPVDDQNRAKSFYKSVFDWTMQEMPDGDEEYTFVITSPMNEDFSHTEKGAINGGIFKRSDEIQNPVITIGVPSIDKFTKKVESAGGKVVVQKGEVPEMGYYAYFKDTEGNILGLWESMNK